MQGFLVSTVCYDLGPHGCPKCELWECGRRAQMGHSLNSLKGGYIGDYIGDYYRAY